jgi:SAM-dependent methyltransferase
METKKNYNARVKEGLISKYCSGRGVDVGASADCLPGAIPFDIGTPGYDGGKLPFGDGELDFVYSSHMLEHVYNPELFLTEWMRVVKEGGYLFVVLPHRDLYEKRYELPSKWNTDHKTTWTPFTLIDTIQRTFEINSYRIVHMKERDDNFDYTLGPDKHSTGSYDLEVVIKKIRQPDWTLA